MKNVKPLWISVGLLSIVGLAVVFLFTSADGDVLRNEWGRSHLHAVLTRPILHLGSFPVTLAFMVETILFLFALGAVVGLTRRILQDRLLSHTALDSSQRFAYSRIASYAIYLIGIAIGLQTAGVNLSSLLVVGGAVGIGVGLGLQSIANNFVSGLVLLFERPIKLGDRVEVGGVVGDVVRMAARSTWVRTNDNVAIIVPNSEFTSTRVVNWTANDRRVRFAVAVGVSYNSDAAKVREILLGIARKHPDVLEDPPPDVLLVNFGDSSVDFELRVWTIQKVQTPKVLSSDLNFAIFETFRKEGIEIPFPQRDLHLKSANVPLTASTNG